MAVCHGRYYCKEESSIESLCEMEEHNIYPTKHRISNEQLDSLNIVRNDLLGKWNDTTKPKLTYNLKPGL